MNKRAIYAGTFDPLTLGHVDIIERAARIFDHLVLAVAGSAGKNPLFGLRERVAMARHVAARFPNVEVDSFEGLLVEYARSKGIRVLIRGLRAYSDFEYEFQMALTNRKMAPDIETLFLMPNEDYSYLSSAAVREIAELGGSTASFVPPAVAKALQRKLGGKTGRKRA